jgi:hypothetical protein
MTETETVRNGIDVDPLLATIDAIKRPPAGTVAPHRPPAPALNYRSRVHMTQRWRLFRVRSSTSTRILLR